MINKFTDKLICPCCGEALFLPEGEKSLYCRGEKRHCHDLSSDGYVNLLAGRGGVGDTKEAVRARSVFLDAGYYAPLSDSLTKALGNFLSPGDFIIDAGCGEGYYTEGLISAGFCVMGFDISKFAVRAAAKRRNRIRTAKGGSGDAFYAVAGIFDMPVPDGSFDGLVNIFAPFAEEEFFRVLKPGGIAAAVSPGKTHLSGLKKVLYSQVNLNDERNDLPKNKKIVDTIRLKYDIIVDGNANIQNLFAMTPYFWRTSKEDAAKLSGVDSLETTADFVITLYQK